MEIKWFSKNQKSIVTIYQTNITLNKVASLYFDEAYKVIIGFNNEKQLLVIKRLSKDDIQSGSYDDFEHHKISINPTYGRISGKDIVRQISDHYYLDFSKNNLYKFSADWDAPSKSLLIYMKGEIN